MGDSLLVGGGSGGGIRTKKITWEQYQQLSESDKNNPYVEWLIVDKDASEFISKYYANVCTIHITWEAYTKLSPDEKLNPEILWIITDKEVADLLAMGIDVSGGSKYYTIGASGPEEGSGSSGDSGISIIDDGDNIGGGLTNIDNTKLEEILKSINEIKDSLGGLKFRVNEKGILQVTYKVSEEEVVV